MIHRSDTAIPSGAIVAEPRRDLPAVAERVLIIGLDGATFDVLNPMIDAGRMPNLKALIDRGASGILESTKPPITPAAWTTFMSGKSPGTHGVIDFERYDVHTGRLSFNTTLSIAHVRTIWQILSDKGFKVGAVNVPMTYPPPAVNGFVITGFETPSTDVEFTYPAELKHDILARWPNYTFKNTWRRKTFGGDRLFAENLACITRSFHEGARITRHCGDTYGWDVLMVVFKLVDNLQHKTWKYLDPRFNRKYKKRAQMVADCFNELDDALGQLFAYADEHRANIFIMSDHGHGSLEGKVQPNLLLKRWGFLRLKPGTAQARTRLRTIVTRLTGGRKGKFAASQQIDRDLALDLTRTQACVMHAGMYGFLYLNLKGRQPGGIVEPADYETLRDELRERFLKVTAPKPADRTSWGRRDTIKLFTHVHKPEELYGVRRSEREWLPDLLLVPAEGLAVVRKIRGRNPVRWLSRRKIEGTHRLDGVLVAAGSGIARGRRLRARLIDSTPTILAMMGLRIPDDMEGRVLTDLFEPELHFETEAASPTQELARDDEVYSEAEQRILTDRLADLGYLE